MDPLTERLGRIAVHLGVTGCSAVALILAATALQQLVFPDNQTALRLKVALFFRPRVVVVDVPYHLSNRRDAALVAPD